MGNYGDWKKGSNSAQLEKSGADEPIENGVLAEVLPDFVDAWPMVRSDEGFTFDGLANPACIPDLDERVRYDRVIVRGLLPNAATLLGTEGIDDTGVCPS